MISDLYLLARAGLACTGHLTLVLQGCCVLYGLRLHSNPHPKQPLSTPVITGGQLGDLGCWIQEQGVGKLHSPSPTYTHSSILLLNYAIWEWWVVSKLPEEGLWKKKLAWKAQMGEESCKNKKSHSGQTLQRVTITGQYSLCLILNTVSY